MTYENAVQNILDLMVKDYEAAGYNLETPEYYIDSGRVYDKIVSNNGAQLGVKGFICKVDNPKKGFKTGDLLMAKSFNAPATNFARGNIFEKSTLAKCIRWTGVL